MKNKKAQLNLISLKEYLKGRDFKQMSKEEQLEVCEHLLNEIHE